MFCKASASNSILRLDICMRSSIGELCGTWYSSSLSPMVEEVEVCAFEVEVGSIDHDAPSSDSVLGKSESLSSDGWSSGSVGSSF